MKHQGQQDEGTALKDCLRRLNSIENAPIPVQDTEVLDEALRAYFVHAGSEKADRAAALHRLIASYVGTRRSTLMSDSITSHLTTLLQQLESAA